jgi:hypothetical protein
MRSESARIAVVVGAFLAISVTGRAQSLTPEQIEMAITWGNSLQPTPYRLRSAFPRTSVPAGAVFTPFLRVALATKSATEEGREFTAEDLTADMVAPVVYIAIRDDGPHSPFGPDTPVSMRLVTEHSIPASGTRRTIPAAWVRETLPAYLRDGLDPEASYVVGAFPMTLLRPDTRVELFRVLRKPGGGALVQTTPALITANDLARWK